MNDLFTAFRYQRVNKIVNILLVFFDGFASVDRNNFHQSITRLAGQMGRGSGF
jgi:hypothetical protein